MLDALLRLSLRYRPYVLALAAVALVVGIQRATEMPVDVFPDLTAPRVTVVTESTGLAAEEVERLITFPLEAAINGTAGLRRVRSASSPGISVVWAEFDWSTPPVVARQRVTERLQSVTDRLPEGAEAPILAPASSVMGEILFIALKSNGPSSIELRRIAEVDVRRRLLGVEGIAQVVPIGGDIKQYQVLVDPVALEAYRLSLVDIVEAIRRGSRNAPGGYLVDLGQESVVRVLGRAEGIEDLASIVITSRSRVPIRVRDVAEVVVGPAPARGAASHNAKTAVVLSIVKQPSADTLSTTSRLDQTLDEIEQALKNRQVILERNVFRQRDFIDTALENVLEVLRDGAVLVIGVLFIFLGSFRPTFISAVALPLSIVIAVLTLDLLGFGLDTMTLGGLAIAIGELVDDAIVDVENVLRRLRERAAQPEPSRISILETVFRACVEVRSAIVSATAVLMLVFVPLLVMEGLEGRLLRPLAIAYLTAIFASLIVALTVTPVLCSWLLPSAAARQAHRPPRVLNYLTQAYARLLPRAIARPRLVVALSLLAVGAGVAGLRGVGRSFLPEFNEGSLTINLVLTPGTSLEHSDEVAQLAERALLEDPGVVSVGRRTGRAERDEHVLGVESSELEVRIDPADPRTRERLFSDIRGRLTAVPGRFTLGQPISHRIEHMISGQRTALSIKVFGEDLSELRQVAKKVESMARGIPGFVDVDVEQIVEVPQLVVDIDAKKAERYGMSRGEAARVIGIAIWGAEPTQIYEEGTATPVVVRYPPSLLSDVDALRRIRVPTPEGALVPLSALATLRRDAGANYILRENVERRVVVQANLDGRDVRSAYEALRAVIDERIPPSPRYRIEYAGQFEREASAGRVLVLYGLFALLGVAVIVVGSLGSFRKGLIVLANIPFALAGGVVGVHLAGGMLSVATMIGFITVFGIATRSGILLVARVGDLEHIGVDRVEVVSRAARERLAPILMTALTAALGLLPLGLALGQPGSEIQAPMALVILTGLASATTLNMVVVPVLLVHFGAWSRS